MLQFCRCIELFLLSASLILFKHSSTVYMRCYILKNGFFLQEERDEQKSYTDEQMYDL